MTSFSRGDIVLVKFVFADEKGVKQRPGLIVSTDRYHQGRRETILAAITSNVGRLGLHGVGASATIRRTARGGGWRDRTELWRASWRF